MDLLKDVLPGVNMQTAILIIVSLQSLRLRRVEQVLNGVVEQCADCPKRRRSKLTALGMVIACLLFSALTSGCVQTRVKFGQAEMTRTALLTKVEVPNIEVATNGTFRASVKSDARTELLESILRLLTAAAP